MKKCQFYFEMVIAILLTLICTLFIGSTAYFLYNRAWELVGVLATLLGIFLTILMELWTLIFRKFPQDIIIERYLNDEHFVDRNIEYNKLLNLIQNEQERIIYINGKLGMGKTLFMKMSCDRINYSDKKKWKSYSAFYYNNNHTKTITQSISNKFCKHSNASVTDISKKINDSTLQKHSILFIDNIYEINLIECIEFAKAYINCNKNNQVVIAVDSSNDSFHICPGKFGENEIELLAKSYNVEIERSNISELSELSNGYPVYARYSIEAYVKGINIIDYNNLENYIEELVNSLNLLEKFSLSLIVCLSNLLQEGIECKIIYGIDNRITLPVIKKLMTYSLINMDKEKIYTDKLISLKCMDFLSEEKNESYNKIYQHYKEISTMSYMALVSALKSNVRYDHSWLKNTLHQQYENNNFCWLIDIGELEFNNQINPRLREDKECWAYVRYYYLKSLLELGLYNKAKKVVDHYENQFNLLNLNSDIDFEYQYLLVDLDHLTNHLKDAVTFSYALLNKALNDIQKVKCQYLYAHCLRHIGVDLDQAYTVFNNLINDVSYKNDKIRIRSIYSAASIKIFQGDLEYPYEEAFDKIEQIMYGDIKNEIWKPYVARHRAIYYYKICKNFKRAEHILQEIIRLLEVTPLRIKYDIYFELGEIYRIWDNSFINFKKSIEYYLKAIQL